LSPSESTANPGAGNGEALNIARLSVERRNFHLQVTSTRFEPGITILVGANGSGKTTLLSALAGRVRSKEFDAELGSSSFVPEMVSMMPQSPVLPRDLTPLEFLEQVAWLQNQSRFDAKQVAEATIDSLDLVTHGDQRIVTLSGGMQRRLAFGAALVGASPVLLLDEPTNDLDPHQRTELLRQVKTMSAKRVVILSSHALRDVAVVADHVVLLHVGRVLFAGAIQEFLETFAPNTKDPEDAYTGCIDRAGVGV